MARKRVLITGCSGLIGSEAVEHFDRAGHMIIGIDNNMRREFFGDQGDTSWNLRRLQELTRTFTHYDADIRDRERIFDLFREHRPDLVIHCAAQPSHDKAKDIPLTDFDVNAVGTINLLEAARQYCADSVFIFMSTNKVYGDAPNEVPLVELETRYDYARAEDYEGIDETCRIDRCLHSVFGASKVAADVMAQEYGKYFGLNVGVFRGGCLTGPSHSGVELHGFLSYLVKVGVTGRPYTIYGYKGKQVRDQIHSEDVIAAFEAFWHNPRAGEVYNIGGGRVNSASVIECIELIEQIAGSKVDWTYQDQNRAGDHVCYISDMQKFRSHYPSWQLRHSMEDILTSMIESERAREARRSAPTLVSTR
jgi:CDP-paratose 2-epimerase